MNSRVRIALIIILCGISCKENTGKAKEATESVTEIKKTIKKGSIPIRDLYTIVIYLNDSGEPVISGEHDQKVALKNRLKGEHNNYIQGEYARDEEKGTMTLDTDLVVQISKIGDLNAEIYFAAPFSISNQGSGIFSYLGLFVYNRETRQIKHLDSFGLGDRVKSIMIKDQIQAVELVFRDYLVGQSYADIPLRKNYFLLSIERKKFVVLEKKVTSLK